MLLSEMVEKELIEMKNGEKFGFLAETECIFDEKTGKIIGFELIEPFRFIKSSEQSKKFIHWQDIQLVGENRILFTETKGMP